MIAVERDLHKVHELTHQDTELIKTLFDGRYPLSKSNHANLLDATLLNVLTLPFQIAQQVGEPRHSAKIDRLLDDYASNYASNVEDFHASAETSFVPSLESALNGDISFYDDERSLPFLYYLSTQYMRTKSIKPRSIEPCNADTSAVLTRVWNVLIHMFATNMGCDLFRDRKRRKLILVHNRTDVPFITGDQPAINLKGGQPHSSEGLSIYYPLSPQLALLLADVDEDPPFATEGVTGSQAWMLNEQMFQASCKQVFALSKSSLVALLWWGQGDWVI